MRCTDCKGRLGEQHAPSCHRQGMITTNSVYGAGDLKITRALLDDTARPEQWRETLAALLDGPVSFDVVWKAGDYSMSEAARMNEESRRYLTEQREALMRRVRAIDQLLGAVEQTEAERMRAVGAQAVETVLSEPVSREAEMQKLVNNINPRAKLPKGFDMWSEKLQVMWLQANQKKEKPGD